MKKFIISLLLFLLMLVMLPGLLEKTITSSSLSRYHYARVIGVSEPQKIVRNGFETYTQKLSTLLISSNKEIVMEHEIGLIENEGRDIKKGKHLVLLQTEDSYIVFDIGRIRTILFLLILFIGTVLFTTGKKGAFSVLGIGISLSVILFFIAPRILHGANPITTAIFGALGILATTMFLSHGVNKKSVSAFFSTVITLLIAGILSYVSVVFASLSGLAVDQATYLNVAGYEIQLQGLLLAGIIISLLGILDDVTITQASIVEALFKSHPKIVRKKLFLEAFNVGRDHIASLVNTLVLVYAGVSLPLFLILYINPSNQPIWVLLNGEVITTEIIRTLCGSIGIILAVPITTLLSVWVFTSPKFKLEFRLRNK